MSLNFDGRVSILDGATAVVAGESHAMTGGGLVTVEAYGTTSSGKGSAIIEIQVSNNGSTWRTSGTINLNLEPTRTSDRFTMDASWNGWLYVRANLSSISGTGASVSVYKNTGVGNIVTAQTDPVSGNQVKEILRPPEGFNFDFSKLPSELVIYKNQDGTIGWSFDETSLIPESARNAPLSRIFHVKPGGSDSNTGIGTYIGDFSNAKKKIGNAIAAGNATGAGYQVIVAPGTYERLDGVYSVYTTQPAWIRGWSTTKATRPRIIQADTITWTLDGTYTNCYKATRAASLRVLDLVAAKDKYGNWAEIPRVATVAECNTTVNSWYTDGTTVYVRRADGAAPTLATTEVLLNSIFYPVNSTTMDFCVSNMEFLGGYTNINSVGTITGAFVDCKFSYQGGEERITADGITLLKAKLWVFVRCEAARTTKDGFNVHEIGGIIPQLLTLDCVAYDCGTVGQTSNNGWTIHDAIPAIDVNGEYFDTRGGEIACADAGTQAWIVGTKCYKSLGDGTELPINFWFRQAGEYWMDTCEGSDSHIDVSAQIGAKVHLRSHKTKGCFVTQELLTGGTIDSY
jgi:hypothetical protein